ncbi:MAG: trypsin-like peptidase domain-containing protein [Candidatus Electrothrix aestuarii]|uniref:Trypsin-like peptidase domain-containing protein n=1 Tax=Candidatus Electrothrix aestuarii TaxID=3062594 RepID=A0AAU8M1D0_9BACT|nr:trypsin-like peptidase domain-containing protein [Candidatus Electrothrix aestuarii]
MSSPSLDTSLVRILLDDQEPRRPLGAGFLVTPKHILTCAHVINAVLGRDEYALDPPAAEIFLDFPLLSLPNDYALLRAKVVHWFPVAEVAVPHGLEDIAVLELCSEAPLSAEVRPAPLVVFDDSAFADCRVRLFGFSIPEGTYANLVLQGKNSRGMVEMHHQGSGQVMPGFSGTAAWAVKENAVCGMVVARRGDLNTAYMIPASILLRAFPEMEQHSRPANPYRGLEAFREKDAALYFGRGQTIARLRQVVAEQPFAAVIGASGSGKSSVVFAGLVLDLRQSGNWTIAHCRPKKQPFYELAACLIPLLYEDPILRSEKSDELKEKLQAGLVGLAGIIRQIKQQNEGQGFLLVIDQFEELFTLNTDQDVIRQYIAILLECLCTEDFTVLLTMRADFFAAAVGHPALAEALDSYAPIILPQIDVQGLREVIEQPAKLLGVSFEAGLVDLIIRDVGQEPGSLPLLEFCLTQLWEQQEFRRITHDAYKDIGGVQQALANHADTVYAEFTEQEREQLRHIFLKLVRPGQGTEDTRQVATVGQIAEEYRGLIARLADKRLIVTGRDEERGEETVEVVHEALIRRWRTLRQWVDEEREFLVWQEKLRVLLRQWEESGKDEGALLRGLPLDEALSYLTTHEKYFVTSEKILQFITISGQFRNNEQQKLRNQKIRNFVAITVSFLIVLLLFMFAVVQWRNAVQQTLTASYNLAKVFEKEALYCLERTAKEGASAYKKALLFASAAAEQEIILGRSALNSNTVGLLFAPDVFNGAIDNTVRFFESETSGGLIVLKEYRDAVRSVAFSSVFGFDGKQINRIVTASFDGMVRYWNIKAGKELVTLGGNEDKIVSVTSSPDNTRIVSVSSEGTMRLWDIKTGRELATLEGNANGIISVDFSPDGSRIVFAFRDGTIRIWNINTGKELNIPERIRTRDITTGKELNIPERIDDDIISVAFTPDGGRIRIALNSTDNTVLIWDDITPYDLAIIKGHRGVVRSVSFSPDGRRIASASVDNTAQILDMWNNKLLSLIGHEGAVNNIAFSSDSRLIASASSDSTVRLWDTATGKELIVFRGHKDAVNIVTFSPDGRFLASGADDRTVRIWDIRPYTLFLHNSNPTPLYHTFIDAVKFLWQLDVQGLEIVETNRRTPADLEKYGSLLAPPPPGQSKFDQVLEWAEKQQGR